MTDTETRTAYGKAEELGYNPAGGKWIAVCKNHDFVLNCSSRERAREASKNPAEFCDDCREMNQDIPEELLEHSEPPEEPVTFTATQTEPVTESQLDDMNTMLEQAHAAWLAEEQAKQVEPDFEAEQMPILGTYLVGDTAHQAVGLSGLYVKPRCNPDKAMMSNGQVADDDERLCAYCMAGVLAPTEEEQQKRRRGRPPKAQVAPEPAPLPQYPETIAAVLQAVTALVAQVEQAQSVPDAVEGMNILTPALESFRKLAPRRRVGERTGARSGLVKQSATVNPSKEAERVKVYADAGDKRAQDILGHIQAYKPGEDCSYCADKGRSTRHGYATAFMSVGRELRAMEQRTGIPLAKSDDS